MPSGGGSATRNMHKVYCNGLKPCHHTLAKPDMRLGEYESKSIKTYLVCSFASIGG
jgi:hypothetical protein